MKTGLTIAIGGLLAVSAAAQTVYNSTPDWTSADTQRGTGGALADINGDGWLDLVVANGNDMARQHLAVYYNNGDGTLPGSPNWQSSDPAYNGHLSVADVNGDGWPDVAVAHLGEFNTFAPIAKLYLNNNGTLSSTPDWQAHISGNAFGVAFGDMNSDGRPDLAVATGWAYNPQHFYNNYVYLNVNGTLEATASWQSDDTYHYQGMLWVDGDRDGWLDLVGVANSTDTRMYLNQAGMLETTASWRTTDAGNQDAIMATAGDVNGDGLRDLFLTDNTQTAGGSGRFRQYSGIPAGSFATTYSWSYYDGYGSAIALADVNADGRLDLATGAWWDNTRIFLNNGTGLPNAPSWSSAVTSVVEKIVFGDVDRNGVRSATEMFAPSSERLFCLAHQPIQEIVAVRRDGVTLGPHECTFSREHGWVSVGAAPNVGLEVEYTYSTSLDMAITNWDSSVGNYLYYNQLACPGDLDGDGDTDLADLGILLADFGCTAPGPCPGDLDNDGDTDLADLGILLADFGCAS